MSSHRPKLRNHIVCKSMILFLLLLTVVSAQTQQNIVLRVALPRSMMLEDEILQTFETKYSELDVQFVQVEPTLFFPDPTAVDPSEYISAIETLVQHADVILVNDSIVFAAVLSSNFLLDLSSVNTSDERFNSSTFHPLASEALRDDSGSLWGLASSININTILYDQHALQAVDFGIPTGNWTLQDYERVALALKTENGYPSVLLSSPGIFTRGLWGQPLYTHDSAGIKPVFAQSAMLDILNEFHVLRDTGLVNIAIDLRAETSYPVKTGSISSVLTDEQAIAAAPFFGDTVGLFAWGFGVSAATEQPELAYELAVHLTTEFQLADNTSGFPTRLDWLVDTLDAYDEAHRALIENAMSTPIPLLDRIYTLHLNKAIETNIRSLKQLDDLQAQAFTLIEIIQSISDNTELALPTPIPIPEPDREGVTLRFGISSRITEVYRREWQRTIEAFAANDSQVADVMLVSPQPLNSIRLLSEHSDCFYLPVNLVSRVGLHLILSISPLIAADATFDAEDFIGTDLSQFRREGQVWALPIVITPNLLQLDSNLFEAANLPAPMFNWTASEFEQSLRLLMPHVPIDHAPMSLPSPDLHSPNSNILMLIAAYGGLPYDFRTSPPTINFTNPEVLVAIRYVLDLAREGLIEYWQQNPGDTVFHIQSTAPVSAISFGSERYQEVIAAGSNWVSYPQSRDFVPVSYEVGIAYISRESQAPEACYRWIRTLANNPHLFFGLPAYRSQIDMLDPAVTPGITIIREYVNLLQSERTLLFPPTVSGLQRIELFWLYSAFDRYVLEGGNLERELQGAEAKVQEFRVCVANIEPATDNSPEEQFRIVTEQDRCAVTVDPAFSF